MTHTRSDVLALLAESGAEPSRALGQNFVVDPNTVRRIVRLAGVHPGDRVVEIGPGLGSLTLALVEAGAEVVAVEADRHLVPVLERVVGDRARLVVADARHLTWSEVCDPNHSWKLVANLPYNLATALVLGVLIDAPMVTEAFVMVQREVAERWAAGPGSKEYGIPSVKVAYFATATVAGTVPATVFHPRPRVESALVRIVRHDPPEVDRARLWRLVDAGFAQRRKMLRRSLAGCCDADAFASAGIDPTRRAETLGLDEWVALTRACLVAGPGESGAGPEEGTDR